MEVMKQTAVQWLRDLYENQPAYDEFILDEQWEKALEMEKEQIIDFAMDYVNSDSIGCLWDGDSAPELDIDTSAEQYYNRIFNTNEK
jgi:hypothetical protein